MVTVVIAGWLGVAVTFCPMKTPLDVVDAMASDMPLEAAWASAKLAVVIVAVTRMEPATIDTAMSAASTPAANAREEM